MIAILKQLLQKSPVMHALARRTRSLFSPLHHLRDLRDAWNYQFYEGNSLDNCFALFKKNRAYQAELVRERIKPTTPERRFLGPEWSANIGTLAHLDTYVKIGLLGWRPPQHTFLTAYPGEIGNRFFLDLWKPFLTILDGPDTLRRLNTEIQLLMDYHLVMELRGRLCIFPHAAALVQKEWESQNRASLLTLDDATKERGRRQLLELGVPRDAWFVALHVRERGFKKDEHVRCVRNAHIDTYVPAVRKIVAAGGWVVRCGDSSATPFPETKGVIDYAHSPLRSDWMDVFLASQCRFLLGTQSGFSHVGDVFGVPTLYTNWAAWGFPPWYKTNVFIPKIFWSWKENRSLTLSEIIQSGIGCCQNPAVFDSRQIEIRNNTPEEIEAAVEQMLQECAGTFRVQTERQLHVKQVFRGHDVIMNARFGDAFLSAHEEQLGMARVFD